MSYSKRKRFIVASMDSLLQLNYIIYFENSFSCEYLITHLTTCVILYVCNYVDICGYKLVQILNSFKARK